MKIAHCPLCNEEIELEASLDAGDTTFCPGCHEELKVASVTPPRLVEPMEEDAQDPDELEDEKSNDELDEDSSKDRE